MKDYSSEVVRARAVMAEIVAHARAFDITRLSYTPPILDRSTTSTQVYRSEETTGLKKFIDSLEHHKDIFDSVSYCVISC